VLRHLHPLVQGRQDTHLPTVGKGEAGVEERQEPCVPTCRAGPGEEQETLRGRRPLLTKVGKL
jgi:hypothetical protein